MKPKNIDEVLMKFKDCPQDDLNYEFYFELIINQYRKLIIKLISNRNDRDDYFQECVMEIPKTVKDWMPEKGAFSNLLVWRLRAKIQRVDERQSIVYFSQRTNKYNAKIIRNKKLTPEQKEELVKRRASRTIQINHLNSTSSNFKGGNFKETYYDERGKQKYIPHHMPTVMQKEFIKSLIKKIKDSDLWYDYYIEELTLAEIQAKMKQKGITQFPHIIAKYISRANEKIRRKYELTTGETHEVITRRKKNSRKETTDQGED